MGKTFVQGLVILIAGIVALALNQALNLGLGPIAFGLGVGAILGLVADGGPVGRVGAFIVGIIVGMAVFVVSVLMLNETFMGQVLAIVINFGLITVICALTGGRLPLWAGFLGSLLVAGAYQFAFAANPAGILSELPQYVTMALVPAALGFLGAVFVADKVAENTNIDEAFEDVAGKAGIDAPPPSTPAQTPAPAPAAGAAGSTNSEGA